MFSICIKSEHTLVSFWSKNISTIPLLGIIYEVPVLFKISDNLTLLVKSNLYILFEIFSTLFLYSSYSFNSSCTSFFTSFSIYVFNSSVEIVIWEFSPVAIFSELNNSSKFANSLSWAFI